jgi:hypothetical protein
MNRAKRHAVSACSLRPANVIPLVVPLARFSAWMARIQADGIAEEETNGSAISRRPRGPSTIAPGWSSGVELPPGRRRRVTPLASGRRSRHSPEIADRFALSAIGNRWAL